MADETAVVIGAGFAGLLAARVLADHIDRVLVLERDPRPLSATSRPGVPQSDHLHVLHEPGRAILDRLFPGIDAELLASGSVRIDPAVDLTWHLEGGYALAGGLEGSNHLLCQSRPWLEHAVLERVEVLPNCEVRFGARVAEVELPQPQRSGPVVRLIDGDGESEMRPDLVIDASGRTSRLPDWLVASGYEEPPVRLVRNGVAYASRTYGRVLDDRAALIIQPGGQAPHRGCSMFPTEGDRRILTLAGWGHDTPPRDEEGFRRYAASLAADDAIEIVMADVDPSEISFFSFRASRRNLYSKVRPFPSGLLPIGDSVCSLNPVYAQGMTSAAMQAAALETALANGPENLVPQKYLAAAQSASWWPWWMGAVADSRFCTTGGWNAPGGRFARRYLAWIGVASQSDSAVTEALSLVLGMQRTPVSLLRPIIIVRVIFGICRTRTMQRKAVRATRDR